MNISLTRRRRKSRIGDNDGQFGSLFLGGPHAIESNGMAFGHVAADDENHIGMINVFIATRRTIAAQAGTITGHCRCHAQPAVRVRVIGAEETFEKFARQIRCLRVQLATSVKRNRLGTKLMHDVAERPGQMMQGLFPGDWAELFLPARTRHWNHEPIRSVHSFVQSGTFGTQATQIGGSILDPAKAFRPAVSSLDTQATAHTAIRADRFAEYVHLFPFHFGLGSREITHQGFEGVGQFVTGYVVHGIGSDLRIGARFPVDVNVSRVHYFLADSGAATL